jgi:hypothetical protein
MPGGLSHRLALFGAIKSLTAWANVTDLTRHAGMNLPLTSWAEVGDLTLMVAALEEDAPRFGPIDTKLWTSPRLTTLAQSNRLLVGPLT